MSTNSGNESSSDPLPPSLKPGTTLGRFVIEQWLAQGAAGAVYRARDPKLNRDIALKVLHPTWADSLEARKRFEREAKNLARLPRHDNIIQVHDVGEDRGFHYIAVEYVPGPSLADLLKRGRPAPREVVNLLLPVIRGLAAAHRAGVLHRDIKPSNILTESGPDGKVARILVCDFGLAASTNDESAITVTGVFRGTLGYASPEQCRGEYERLVPSSDLFSVGACLYQALAGRVPFAGGSPYEVMKNTLEQQPAAPTEDEKLSAICFKCLEKNPADRYPSAEDLEADLRQWLEGGAISAPSKATTVSPGSGPVKPAKRFTILGAIGLLAISVSLGAISLWSRISPEPAPSAPSPPVDSALLQANEQAARAALEAIARAEEEFRSHDRDANGVADYWTGDVSGLYSLIGTKLAGETVTGKQSPLGLIELSIAAADAMPLPEGAAGGSYVSLSKFGSQSPRQGYFFRTLRSDRAEKEAPLYQQDTGGSPAMGAVHHLSKYGFAAYPERHGVTGVRSFILDQSGAIYAKDLGGKQPVDRPESPAGDGWTVVLPPADPLGAYAPFFKGLTDAYSEVREQAVKELTFVGAEVEPRLVEMTKAPGGNPAAEKALLNRALVKRLKECGDDSLAFWRVFWDMAHDSPQDWEVIFQAASGGKAQLAALREKFVKAQMAFTRFMMVWKQVAPPGAQQTLNEKCESEVKASFPEILPGFCIILEYDMKKAFAEKDQQVFRDAYTRKVTAIDQVKSIIAVSWARRRATLPFLARHLDNPSYTAQTMAAQAMSLLTGKKVDLGVYQLQAGDLEETAKWWSENKPKYEENWRVSNTGASTPSSLGNRSVAPPPTVHMPTGTELKIIPYLEQLASAEEAFRSEDLDHNGLYDYWTGDVSGLNCLLGEGHVSVLAGNPVTVRDFLGLIDLPLAAADQAPLYPGSAGGNHPGMTGIAPLKPLEGYYFRVVRWDHRGDAPERLQVDTGGKPAMGPVHHPSHYVICAFPEQRDATRKATFVVTDPDRIYVKDNGSKPVEEFQRDETWAELAWRQLRNERPAEELFDQAEEYYKRRFYDLATTRYERLLSEFGDSKRVRRSQVLIRLRLADLKKRAGR